jgi:putative ABC transport system ATP-binding protein
MIALEGVGKTFNAGGAAEVRALQPTALHLAAGTFLVLVGGNGSGKTTLLDIVSGALPASGGRVLIKGVDVTALPEHRRSRWVARVFQNPLAGTASDLTVLDNFRLAALRTRAKRLVIGVDEAFRRQVRERIAELGLGLEDKLHQPMGALSGGQRQALTLLMSVMDHTDILLLDEPTAALDPHSARMVLRLADRLIAERKLTAIFITHNLSEAMALGSRLIQLDRGRIVRDLDGAAKRALRLEEMQRWFG